MTDGAARLLVRVERPRLPQLFPKAFLELLETTRHQVVLAVDGVLETKVVEDSGHELPAFRIGEGVR